LRDYGRYRGADVVTPNREELCTVVGRRLESLETLAQAAKELMTAHEFNAVVVTVDRDGALLIERSGRPREKPVSTSSGAPAEAVTESPWRHIPTMPRSVYDNTGAGDAVLAMLAAATAAGADLEIAVRLANVAGGLEVEKFGCVPITADQVLAELRIEDRMRNGKLCTGDELVAELQLRRDRGETVAFTNGCFDILHAGHVDLLKRARQEASLLVVGLNGDASVRSQNKSPGRPINRFEHRAAVLGALECVDYVVGFDGPTPEGLIHRVRPDVLIKGEDWAKKGVVGAEFVKSIGGRVVLLPLVEGLSTTKLIERLSAGG
jgi:D-beta-D-heptose 7-phosphate kinase/D-beta-D-heptose 1-phosphate adenosyltransferase